MNLKAGDKSKARNAYFSAYSLNYDKQIREESLFNYAKLCYETGFSPYNDAIKYFQQYIVEYPQSPNKDEAYQYLINCFRLFIGLQTTTCICVNFVKL